MSATIFASGRRSPSANALPTRRRLGCSAQGADEPKDLTITTDERRNRCQVPRRKTAQSRQSQAFLARQFLSMVPFLTSSRWRFSLRFMLAVVAGLCLSLGWWVNGSRRQRDAAAWAREHGGEVVYDY